ncbi:MAG TPA: DUF1559 domain-containing protein [Pirellulales bacterium]|nr:DUF1559 domain-containing protein [Pirellulales bacterium]
MAGLFICPHCGAATQVSAEFAGQSGPCGSCGRIITVPAQGAQSPRMPGNRSMWIWVAIALFTALIATALVIGGKIVIAAIQAKLQQQACSDQLHKIWVALDGYYNEYGEYPPAAVRDKSGAAMHSWRVLLLPFLGEKEEKLYKEYRFDEPWDGPNNRDLAELMPQVYGCPCDPAAFVSSQTSYLAVIDGATGDFAEEPENPDINRPPPKSGPPKPKTRLLVTEVAESGVLWLEPRDLALAGRGARPTPPKPNSFHVGGVNALLRDGQIEALPEPEAQAEFAAAAE